MTRLRPTLLAAVLVAAGHAASPAGGQSASISGTVYEAGSSTPIEKAEIVLYQSRGLVRFIRTDNHGRFAFQHVEPVTLALTANKNGYVCQKFGSAGHRDRSSDFKIQPGQKITSADFYLERAAVVTGRILNQDGDPAPNSYVHLMVRTYGSGHRQLSPRGVAQTNDLGEYRIHNAAPGAYVIVVDYADGLLSDAGVKYEGSEPGDYDRMFYPGVRDPDEATPVRLGAGEVRAIDMQLRRVPTVRVSGRVRLAGGGLLPEHINLEIYPAWDITGRLRRKFASPETGTGTFEFPRVPRGPYVVRALEYVDGVQVFLHQKLEVMDADIEDLELTLGTGATIRGRVTVVGKKSNEFSFEKWPLGLSLFSFPHNPGNTTGSADEPGTVLIESIVPATYTIGVRKLPPDAYLKSVRLADRELPDRKLTLQEAETVDGLEVVVSLDGGRVDGIVLDDNHQPASSAIVVAVPADTSGDRLRHLRTAETDLQGRYRVRGLAPGRYRLLAFDVEELEPGIYRDPDFLEKYRDQGEDVEVEGALRRDLTLSPQA